MRPPRLAEWLLALLIDDADRSAAILGDLEEEFHARAAAGRREARRWYWRQALHSLPPLARRRRPDRTVEGRLHPMTSLGQDVRFALRMLRRRPFVSGVALVSLSLGIGMAVGAFSLLDAAVLRPLPLREPHALRVVLEQRERGMNHNFTYPGFAAFRAVQESFTDLVAYRATTAALDRPAGSEVVAGELVSGSFFSTLGPPLAFGRGLTDADMAHGAPEVVVLSLGEWRSLFGDTTELGGRSVRLNERSFAVVGVAAASFHGMEIGRDARFWAPLSSQPILDPYGGASFLTMPTVSWLTVLGRLRPGVGDRQAVAELEARGQALTQRRAGGPPARFVLAPGEQGDSELAGQAAGPLGLLLGASLLVLIVACANAAGLLVARAGDRSREMAVRAALGAGRGRIARLLLLESGVLGAAGTGMGLVGAVWLTPLAVPMFAVFGEQITLDLHANWRMMTFAGAAGLVSALAAGLAPILRSARATTRLPLHDGGRLATAGVATTRWGRRLVIAQFAVTLGLVVTAGLLVRTFWNLQSIPTGLDVDHVALVGVDTQAAQLDPPAMRAYVARVTERLTSLTGVRAAGFGRVIPLGFGGSRMTIRIPGYEPAPDEDMELNYNVVSPGYFDALGIGIVDGRALDATDTDRGRLAVVVNETMARRYWPGGRAVGRQMRVGGDSPPLQVVGVARDVKYRTIRERPRPSFYLSLLQAASPRGGTFHIRTAGDPADMLVVVRHAVGEADPAVPVTRTLTLRDQLLLNINRERVTMVLGLGLGLTALLLAAVGLFGAMANLVGSRTRELGVRLALGAVPGQLARLVLKTGLVMALWGSLFGLLLASALGGIVGTLLYGVGAIDPLTVLASVAALVAVAGVAAWLPARRAARVDPVVALRVE